MVALCSTGFSLQDRTICRSVKMQGLRGGGDKCWSSSFSFFLKLRHDNQYFLLLSCWPSSPLQDRMIFRTDQFDLSRPGPILWPSCPFFTQIFRFFEILVGNHLRQHQLFLLLSCSSYHFHKIGYLKHSKIFIFGGQGAVLWPPSTTLQHFW